MLSLTPEQRAELDAILDAAKVSVDSKVDEIIGTLPGGGMFTQEQMDAAVAAEHAAGDQRLSDAVAAANAAKDADMAAYKSGLAASLQGVVSSVQALIPV